jgi:hypothetical protein
MMIDEKDSRGKKLPRGDLVKNKMVEEKMRVRKYEV